MRVLDISVADVRVPISEWLQGFRAGELALLRLRFRHLPWTSFLACAPRDHVFGMCPQLVTPFHARWLTSLLKSEDIRLAFVREHVDSGISLAQVPSGFYAYGSADPAESEDSRVGHATAPLEFLWFTSFLVPQNAACESAMIERIKRAHAELGWFFLRPFADSKVSEESLPHRDSNAFGHLLFDAGPSRFDQAEPALEEAIHSAEKGAFVNRDSLSTATTYFGRCTFPLHSSRGEDLSALRSRLIRLLGWPLFHAAARKGLASGELHERNGQVRAQLDAIGVELKTYLRQVEAEFPILIDDPFEPIWKAMEMPATASQPIGR